MADNTIHLRKTRDAICKAIYSIPINVKGGRDSAAEALLLRAGLALLGRIKKAFIDKSRGGTDEAGDRWAPLSPKTIAYGRKAGRTKTEKRRDSAPSQGLTKKQQTRWWDLYRQGLGMFKGDKGSAAKRAWAILKREGATTLLNKYGNRRVEILRDTGLLLNSLSPGSGSPNQVLRVEAGAVIIGTNRKGASAHHNGSPSRGIPQRRLWPAPSKWPASWWADITREVKLGMIDITMAAIQNASTT